MVPHPPLIVPEVGKGEEKKIQDTIDAYHKVSRKIGEMIVQLEKIAGGNGGLRNKKMPAMGKQKGPLCSLLSEG